MAEPSGCDDLGVMRAHPVLLALTLASAAAAACGQTADSASGAAPQDSGATDAGASSDGASPIDANASVTSDATTTPDASCIDASVSPLDGGACDWSRIRTAGIASSQCIALGVFCDTFQFSFSPSTDGDPSIPAGFACSLELGVKTCSYMSESGAGLKLDATSLGAACEVTRILPNAIVSCAVYE